MTDLECLTELLQPHRLIQKLFIQIWERGPSRAADRQPCYIYSSALKGTLAFKGNKVQHNNLHNLVFMLVRKGH